MRTVQWILSVLLIAGSAQARLNVSFDHALFHDGASGNVRLEVYYLIERGTLQYKPVDDGYEGVYAAYIQVFAHDDSVFFSDAWERQDHVSDTARIASEQKIPDQISTVLPPGRWTVRAHIQDRNGGDVKKAEWNVVIDSGTVSNRLSDVVLLSRFPEETDEVQLFNRHGLLVVPYADGIFGAGLPDLVFYAEYYPLSGMSPGSLQATIQSSDHLALTSPVTVVPEQRDSVMIVRGRLPVADLPSGSYYLDLALDNGMPVQKKFFMYNPSVKSLPVSMEAHLQSQEFADMDSLELLQYFAPLKYVAEGVEISQFRELGTEGRRQFLMAFWQRRNPSGSSRDNPYKRNFLKRLDYANNHFATSLQEGWETDRGRVWLKYGEPTHIDREQFSSSGSFRGGSGDSYQDPNDFSGRQDFDRQLSGDYEVWHYDQLEGGVLFVFIDRSWLGDYVLVHSTKTGEIQNYEWMKIVQ